MKKMWRALASMLLASILAFGSCAALADASNYIDAPIANHDVTLKIYTYCGDKMHNTYTDFNEVYNVQVISSITGLDFEWMMPPIGDDGTYFNTTIASGIYPDIWHTGDWRKYPGGIQGAIEDGLLLDISKLAFEKCPNFVKKYNSLDANTQRLFWSDDGYLVGFGARLQGEVIRGKVHQGYFVRSDKLAEYGMDAPVTLEEYEALLEAFKNDPTIKEPLALAGVDDNLWKKFNPFASAFGVAHGGFQRIGDEATAVAYSRALPAYKDYLTLLNSWYNKGYFTGDFANRKIIECEKMFSAGDAGMAMFGNWKLSSINETGKMANPDFVAEGVSYMRLTEDQPIHLVEQMTDVINQFPMLISADCKNVDEALAFVDWLYRDGINTLTTWGPTIEEYSIWPLQYFDQKQGKIVEAPEDFHIYYVNEDGEKRFTDEFFKGYSFFDPIPNNFTIEWESDRQHSQYFEENELAWERFGYNSDQAWQVESFITMTVEESQEYSEIMNAITTYTNECVAKMIVGAMPIDDFDAMNEQMDKMGMKRATEIVQAAYERFLAR